MIPETQHSEELTYRSIDMDFENGETIRNGEYTTIQMENEAVSNKSLIDWKISEANKRGFFKTLDLFAGCGGMSLGFDRAGFQSVGCVEINQDARLSHELNFNNGRSGIGYRSFSDICSTEPEDSISHIEPFSEFAEKGIDIIIGGPPCQAYSRLGRAALWNLAGERFAHAKDERGSLYNHFLHYVATLKPVAFVMENVREIGKYVGRNVAEEISLTAEDLGYETRYAILNAVWYGVPQLRERMFIIGVHKSLGKIPTFPLIERSYLLPVGYSTSRAGSSTNEVCQPSDHFFDHCEKKRKMEKYVSVEEAFADLPQITHHLDGREGRGLRRDLKKEFPYSGKNNNYTLEMKNWPHFESKKSSFTGHVIRYTPRDYEIFRRMPHGGMYPEALEVAETIFQEKLEEYSRQHNEMPAVGSPVWEELRKKTVPPYKDGRYPNKFRKMWPDHPSRTLPAHIGKDSYSHIHYDSDQARGISLREAARIQSFPDGFRFSGGMNSVLTQIGNAVPPLLAFAVAKALNKTLTSSK